MALHEFGDERRHSGLAIGETASGFERRVYLIAVRCFIQLLTNWPVTLRCAIFLKKFYAIIPYTYDNITADWPLTL